MLFVHKQQQHPCNIVERLAVSDRGAVQTERQQDSAQGLDRGHIVGRKLGSAVLLLRDLGLEVDVLGKGPVQIAFNDFGVLV